LLQALPMVMSLG